MFAAQYANDTWNRIQTPTCPGSGEVLTIKYYSGGDITKKTQTAVNMLGGSTIDLAQRAGELTGGTLAEVPVRTLPRQSATAPSSTI